MSNSNGRTFELPQFPDSAWRGLFAEWRAIVEPITECTPLYHFANLLAVLAAEIIQDRIVLAEGPGLYLNFYLFCCGITGTKKSTASDLVRDCIVARLPDRLHNRLSSVSSAEGLIRTLEHTPNLFLCYDEVKDLFATASRTGNRIESTLNTAFGLGDVSAIVKKVEESVSAKEYFFNLLVNGTPEHVQEVSSSLYHGGLINRFLVFAGEPTNKKFPRMKVPDEAKVIAFVGKIAALRNAWHQIAAQRRSITADLSPEAEKVQAEWYNDHEDFKRSQMHSLDAKSITRLDVFAKKLATVYCLLESAPSTMPRATPEQMAAAIDVITYCQESMLWMTRSWSGLKTAQQQSEAMVEQRVEAYLQTHGCMKERHLYQMLHLSAGDCTKAVNTLVTSGQVNVDYSRPRMVHYKGNCKCFRISVENEA